LSDNDDDDDEQDLPSQREQPLVSDYDLNGPKDSASPTVIEDEEDRSPQDTSADFLHWHHRLGHISPKKIRLMAKEGILPRKLADCKVPRCTSCLFGKATRRPWRSKTPNNQTDPSRTIIKPGDCVSVDQLESTTPGLIAQL
jgi:GAG-pre-integrase domain